MTVHMMKKSLCLGMLGGVVIATANPAEAGLFTLKDQNSEARFNTQSQSGMYDWIVDGVDHMFQQWFWFRTGGMENERSVDTLAIGVEGVTDTNFDGDPDTLFVRYLGSTQTTTFDIELRFGLQGGQNGTNISDIAEQIAIHNTGRGRLDLSLFQYNDADLNGGSQDTSININGSPENTARQTDSSGANIHETVVTPSPMHYEANYFGATLTSLNDGSITNLNDVNTVAGPGDFTWAFQWDVALASGGSYVISKDKGLAAAVPAPGAAALGFLGMGLLGLKKKKSLPVHA